MRTFTFDTIADYRAAKATSGSGNVIYQALVGDTSVYSGSVVSKIKTGETFVDSINPFVTPDLGTDGDTLYKITDNGVVKYMYLRKGKTTWDSESFGQVFIKTDRLPTGSYTQVTNQSQVFTFADTKTEATGSGRARIAKIKGNSLGWNQLVQNGDNPTTSAGWSVNNGALSNGVFTASAQKGYVGCPAYPRTTHKILFVCVFKTDAPANTILIYTGNTGSDEKRNIASSGYQVIYDISRTWNGASGTGRAYIQDTRTSGWTGITIKSMAVFDLTLLYGTAISGLTDDQIKAKFEAEYPNPYYAYDAGSLLNFKGKGMKVAPLGLNIWDEETQDGAWYTIGGAYNPSATQYMSIKNMIRVVGGSDYYLRFPSSPNESYWFWYDKDNNYISYNNNAANVITTAPSNAAYAGVSWRKDGYGTTYNHDICINLSGPRNGQYEPYKSSIIPINITSLRDKATHNLIFPNGLLSAGSVYDEIDLVAKKAIKRVGRVDLGSLSWTRIVPSFVYYNSSVISDAKKPASNSDVSNLTVPIYTVVGPTSTALQYDLRLGLSSSGTIQLTNNAHNTAPTSADNWLSGVWLNYELAAPIEYDLSLPLFGTYPADEYVTKQLLPINGETPTTSPMSIEIQQL